MNNFNILGKLQEEPERFEGGNGTKYGKIKIEVDRNRDELQPEVFEVVLFRSLLEVELHKGQIVCISGRLQANNFNKENVVKYNTNLVANNLKVVA